MSVIITKVEIPKTCGSCEASGTSVCRKWTYKDCGQKRADDCPLKSVEGLIEKIEEAKQHKGKSGNPYIDAYDKGLDRYFDLGLERAIHIIKEYCEVEE